MCKKSILDTNDPTVHLFNICTYINTHKNDYIYTYIYIYIYIYIKKILIESPNSSLEEKVKA